MTSTSDDYVGIHIYYRTQDLRPVLLDCVAPLIEELLETRAIRRFFTVRYWEGGSHVRLRLLPESNTNRATVIMLASDRIERFLEISPSLFEPEHTLSSEAMRTMFIREYGQAAFDEKYGSDGIIALRPNNSYEITPYLPEYDRYGGPYGMALSEEHFQLSSRISFQLLREPNSRIQANLLGTALQLMLHFALNYLTDLEHTRFFFRRYHKFIRRFALGAQNEARLSEMFMRQSKKLQALSVDIHATQGLIQRGGLGAFGEFARSAPPLRERAMQLFAEGKLVFDAPVSDADEAVQRLLTSYLHMFNNRLGVTPNEEVYLAYMLERLLEDADERDQQHIR